MPCFCLLHWSLYYSVRKAAADQKRGQMQVRSPAETCATSAGPAGPSPRAARGPVGDRGQADGGEGGEVAAWKAARSSSETLNFFRVPHCEAAQARQSGESRALRVPEAGGGDVGRGGGIRGGVERFEPRGNVKFMRGKRLISPIHGRGPGHEVSRRGKLGDKGSARTRGPRWRTH